MNDEQVQLELTVASTAENIPLVRHAVAGFLDGHSLSGALASDVLLAVTEACTNVVQHAYRDGEAESSAEIEVSAQRDSSALTIAVRDRGRGFAPRVDSPGLGLGLPVIAALTQNVEIRPFPPSGTEVVMTFDLGDS
jgi:anti-sigma regulatory factor (Ser/Thr protein kinase)